MTIRILEFKNTVAFVSASALLSCTVSSAFAQMLPIPTPLITVRVPNNSVSEQAVQPVAAPVIDVNRTVDAVSDAPDMPQTSTRSAQDPVIEASYEPFLPVQNVPSEPVVQPAAVADAPMRAENGAEIVNSTVNDNWLFVAAGQVGGQNNTYSTVGVVAPLPGSSLGDGWVVRVFADELTYRFRDSDNRKIDALGLGGSAAVGYMQSDANGWWGLYAGPAYRHVQLSPHDPGSEGAGGRISARLQAEGEQYVSEDLKLAALAGTDISSNTGYWSRVRALHRVEGDIHAGPEAFLLGDEDYSAYQVGLAVTGIHLTDKAVFGVNGGYRKSENESGSAYGGLELGAEF